MITIRRACALGDIIQAIPIAQAVMAMGHKVELQCVNRFHCVVRRFGVTPSEYVENSRVDVELDNTYEQYRKSLRIASIRKFFYQFAAPQLASIGIDLKWEMVKTPKMGRIENREFLEMLVPYPRPWTMICPRSSTPVNGVPRSEKLYQCLARQVPDDVWEKASSKISGTCFWLGIHGPPPMGIMDLGVKNLEEVLGWMDNADRLVTVDTGPMHIALSMRVPTVCVHQSIDPRMTFEGAEKLTLVSPNLDCLGCCLIECPIDPESPPCRNIDPEMISNAVNEIPYE